jgi:hypothetical protein
VEAWQARIKVLQKESAGAQPGYSPTVGDVTDLGMFTLLSFNIANRNIIIFKYF